ncbi:MAG: PDZ domain-containing protein [Elusimicrobia bacterium]|nr:PDZ domain-containing protein [Elusimicrobiota bacterium]
MTLGLIIMPFLLCASCVRYGVRTVQEPAEVKSIWTAPEPEWIFYKPRILSSVEEAVANVKNIQNRLMFEGMVPSELDIDKYGLRAKLKWVTTQKGERVTSTTGGFWYGWSWISTASSTIEPWTKETPQEKLVIIPFKDVVKIQFLVDIWVDVWMNHGGTWEELVIKTKDKGAAKDLIDALYTLKEMATGIKTEFYPMLGMSVAELTGKQKEALGITGGMLVLGVGEGGPAFLAGIKYPDVITEVNGEQVSGKDDGLSKVKGSPAAVKLKVIKWAADEKYTRGAPKPKGITKDGGRTTTYNYAEYEAWKLQKPHLPTLDRSNIRVVEITIEKR